MQLFVTRTYERAIRKLISEEARKEMEAAIVADPDEAPVIRGTGDHRSSLRGILKMIPRSLKPL